MGVTGKDSENSTIKNLEGLKIAALAGVHNISGHLIPQIWTPEHKRSTTLPANILI